MKAVRIHTFGLDGLAMVDLADPMEPKDKEILVRLQAVSLNYRDLLMVKGLYNPDQALPLIPCSDGAGEVVAVGKAVQSFRPGDRVVGTFFQDWLAGPFEKKYGQSVLGGPLDGTLAEYIFLKEEGALPIPKNLSFEEAATLPCAALTAWNGIVEEAALSPGQTVVVQGSGGVSLFSLQFAMACGAQVIFLSRSEEKIEKAKKLGAKEGIHITKEKNWHKKVRELTEGRGADVLINVLGGDLEESIKAVKHGGMICSIGILIGSKAQIDVVSLLMRQAKIHGIYVGNRLMFEAMNRAITTLGIKPLIDTVFPFSQYKEAFLRLESGEHFGKIVLRLGDTSGGL
ncbi:NADPH:quinone oxidoreductase [Methylacidiphilum sp. Yel]|uniref:zinc-dependent alcohol dehydrogenase family protein n=1 Tax=Methylacidiphilum sp. Yel TaxID=1847730 RepID=UPI00106CA2D5|nr:NAD(P)-dependent alcohol dehydrogenase [Methylacidiphilum sp. Yel]TFE71011.1 NADPH:quinone oxidoreductase [Methylacidiphilum sp. Yel]